MFGMAPRSRLSGGPRWYRSPCWRAESCAAASARGALPRLAVRGLTAGEMERDSAAVLIGQVVYLGRSAAGRSHDLRGLLPPFPHHAQRCAFAAGKRSSARPAAHRPKSGRRRLRSSRLSPRSYKAVVERLLRAVDLGRIDPAAARRWMIPLITRRSSIRGFQSAPAVRGVRTAPLSARKLSDYPRHLH